MFRNGLALATLPAVALAACSSGGGGGGGIATTPPVVVAPTPTPSASASPTPTPSNTSLNPIQFSETFSTQAGAAAATFNGSTVASQSAAFAPISVAYDSATGNYTVSRSDRSQTFRNADRITGTASTNEYARTTGNVTDNLSLTRPGTTGALTYRYVGGGFWQRQTNNGGSIRGEFDAFHYGVKTTDALTPRTGAAGYAVGMLGVMTGPGEPEPLSMGGTGTLSVDFATGRILTDGIFNLSRTTGPSGYSGVWAGSAQLAATNSFTGTMQVLAFGTYDGGLSGAFFGPAAEEVGASFWGRSGTGDSVAGTILGRQDPNAVVGSNTLASINTDTRFNSYGYGFTYSAASGVSLDSGGTTYVDYVPSAGRYTFVAPGGAGAFGFTPAISVSDTNKLAVQTDARYTAYRTTLGDGRTADVRIYKPGSGNTELALTYSSFAEIHTFGGTAREVSAWTSFGVRTPLAQIPRAGTATYSGVLKGVGSDSAGLYNLAGTSRYTVDFAGIPALVATLRPIGTNMTSGATVDFGNFVFQGQIDRTFGESHAFIMGSSSATGDLYAVFFGPRVDEMVGPFQIQGARTDGSFYRLGGISAVKKD